MYGGFLLERLPYTEGRLWRRRLVLAAGILGISGVMAALTKPSSHTVWSAQNLTGILGSFKATEVHWSLSLLAAMLTGLALLDLVNDSGTRLVAAAGLLSCCALWAWAGLPVLLVWAAASLVRSALFKRWMLAGLVSASVLLPAISPTGSPTYAVFALVACVVATGIDNRLLKLNHLRIEPLVACCLASGAVVLVLMLRSGIHIPFIFRFAEPVLAEREKTYQLEEIIDWWRASPYRNLRLVLYRDAADPIQLSSRLGTRRFRPPTYQKYLDIYDGHVVTAATSDALEKLVVTFGDDELLGQHILTTVDGRFAGPARVHLVDSSR
jgi:hypothetical protein